MSWAKGQLQLTTPIQLLIQRNYDLKYRYIKSTNGITPEDLYKLEDIFHFNPDEKLIREIRHNAEN